MYSILFIHSSIDKHLGCFHVFHVLCVAMNIGVHVSFQVRVLSFPDISPEMRLQDHIVTVLFFYLKNFHTILHRGSTNLHSHQQYRRVPFFPCPLQHLLFVGFLMVVACFLSYDRISISISILPSLFSCGCSLVFF